MVNLWWWRARSPQKKMVVSSTAFLSYVKRQEALTICRIHCKLCRLSRISAAASLSLISPLKSSKYSRYNLDKSVLAEVSVSTTSVGREMAAPALGKGASATKESFMKFTIRVTRDGVGGTSEGIWEVNVTKVAIIPLLYLRLRRHVQVW